MAAPGLGAVHDVVVDQGAGVHELEGGDGAEHRRVVLATAVVVAAAGGAAPAPVGEGGAQPLAALGQGPHLVDDRDEARVHRGQGLALPVEEVRERVGDGGAEAIESRRRERRVRTSGAGPTLLRACGHAPSIDHRPVDLSSSLPVGRPGARTLGTRDPDRA